MLMLQRPFAGLCVLHSGEFYEIRRYLLNLDRHFNGLAAQPANFGGYKAINHQIKHKLCLTLKLFRYTQPF